MAVEASGVEYDREYRCYGGLRLVSYAQFLMRYYFNVRQRLCQGEGVAMRAYAMDQTSAELLALYADMTETFSDVYFGRKAPVLPNEAMLKSEERWRKVHIELGPCTKGSAVDSDVVTRQI